MAAPGAPVSLPQVQSILEQRCIVCHGCYEAPCQLLLSSNAGIERGATKAVVYDTDRLTATEPTRLFIDAHSTAEWRQRNFFSVGGDAAAPGSATLLFLMLELGRANPFAPGEKLPNVRGAWIAPLPEVAFLRVRAGAEADGAAIYSLVHNRAHTNVAYMFGEEEQLVPADDTLTVTRGTLGSYPNFLFDVAIGEIDAFTTALRAVQNPSDLEQLVARWGTRRTSPRFWATIDWLHDDFRRRQPAEFGLFDLGRYGNL